MIADNRPRPLLLVAGATLSLLLGCAGSSSSTAPVVASPTASVTPTPVPTVSASVAPTPTATSTPTIAPTASPIVTASPTSSPAPSVTPTPTPMQTLLTGFPSTLDITGVNDTQTFSVSDSDASYAGFFTTTTESAAIATVRQGSGPSTFIVTSVSAGTTYIDVSTTDGGFLREPVTVMNSGVIVSAKGRK